VSPTAGRPHPTTGALSAPRVARLAHRYVAQHERAIGGRFIFLSGKAADRPSRVKRRRTVRLFAQPFGLVDEPVPLIVQRPPGLSWRRPSVVPQQRNLRLRPGLPGGF
jgi:hypothetical protein